MTPARNGRKNLVDDERGTSLVETAAVMPFLLVLGLGVFEFGNILYNHHLVDTGVRDAARYLARFRLPEMRETEAKELAVTGSTAGGTKRVAWWDTDDVTVSYKEIANPPDETGERPYRGLDPIRVVQVTTNVTYGGLGFLGFLGLGDSLTFSTAHEERVIGD
jgi:hypothetical protein